MLLKNFSILARVYPKFKIPYENDNVFYCCVPNGNCENQQSIDLWELNYEAILTIDDKIAWDTLSSGTFITICFYCAYTLVQKRETKKCRKKQQTNIEWRGWVGRDPVVLFSKNNTPHLTPITESGMTKPLNPKLRPGFELLFVLVHNYVILNILEYYQSNTLQIEVYLVMLRSFLGAVCILPKGTNEKAGLKPDKTSFTTWQIWQAKETAVTPLGSCIKLFSDQQYKVNVCH